LLKSLASRHVDFLLCHPNTLAPIAGVNLEPKVQRDSDLNKLKTDARTDSFTEDVLRLANVPLLKLVVSDDYDPADISRRLKLVLAGNTTEQEMEIDRDSELVATPDGDENALSKLRGVASGLQSRIPGKLKRSA